MQTITRDSVNCDTTPSSTRSWVCPDTFEDTETNYFERMGKALKEVTSKNPDKEQLIYFRYLALDPDHRQEVADDIEKACSRAKTVTKSAETCLSDIIALSVFLPPNNYPHTLEDLHDLTEGYRRYRPTFMLDAITKGDEPTFKYLYDQCCILNQTEIPQRHVQNAQINNHLHQYNTKPSDRHVGEDPPYDTLKTLDINSQTEPTADMKDTCTSGTTRDPLAIELTAYARRPAQSKVDPSTIDLRRSLPLMMREPIIV